MKANKKYHHGLNKTNEAHFVSIIIIAVRNGKQKY